MKFYGRNVDLTLSRQKCRLNCYIMHNYHKNIAKNLYNSRKSCTFVSNYKCIKILVLLVNIKHQYYDKE